MMGGHLQAEARAKAAEETAAELRAAAEDAEAELIGVREESHAALQAADSRCAGSQCSVHGMFAEA